MKFLIEIEINDAVYPEARPELLAGEIEREVNCLLDDAYSQHIKVTEVKPGSLLDKAAARGG